MYSLRQLFEPARSRPATTSLLLTEHATILLADQSQVWVDADAFEALLTRARATNDPGQAEQLLEEAMLLYAGDYLPEERHVEWTQMRRESLLRGWIGLLLELVDLRIAREAISSAIDTLDRLLAIDPTNEAAVQRLILLLAQAGRRGEALRIYQRFAATLKQEYKMAPLQETRALYEAAQRGNSAALKLAAGPTLPATSAAHEGQPLEPEARPAMLVGRRNQSHLVGRDAELAALRQVLLDTEQSRRMKLAGQKKSATSPALESGHRVQCVLLMGDVGIGKTRLAEEIGREASRRGWTVTWTRAYIQETSIPYRMWTETLRKAMTRGLWQRQEIARRPLVYQALRALLPELENLLPPSDPSAVSQEQEQLRLWEAARALLATISESAPLLIVLDDLQWADSSSCELLAYLVRQLRHQPVLIVGTCRDIELPPTHPLRSVLNDLQREQSIETLTVQPLTGEQIRALISPLPEPVAQRIQARAAGNPFFAEELARNISDTPALASNLSAALDLPTTLPDTIAAVLDLRLGRISSDCQRLLVRAAVLGGSFEFSALRALESGPNASDEDTLLDLLEEALQAGMLSEEGSGTRITYHFWHPLLVSHLYDGLSAGRRASLHRRAADALIRLYSDRAGEQAAAIAYHLVNGGSESATIAHYAELAGDRAYALSAYPEAVRHYKLALENIGTLAGSASADEHLRLANLLERLGECARVLGNYEEACGYFERALRVREQYHQIALQIDSQYEAQIDALLWIEVGRTWFDRRDNVRAMESYNRAEDMLHGSGIEIGSAWASLRLQQSYILWQEGNFEQASQIAKQALTMFENALADHNHSVVDTFHSTSIGRTLAGDPVDLGRTHTLLAAVAATVGESTDALYHLNTALPIFEQHERQREIAIVSGNIGDVYLRKAEHILAQAAFRRSLGIAERIGEIQIMSADHGNLGVLSARFGNLVEAQDRYKQAVVLAEQVNDPVYLSFLHCYLAITLQDQAKLEAAKKSLWKALKISRAMNFTPGIGFALVALGHLRITQALVKKGDTNHTANAVKRNSSPTNLLYRAKTSLQHALALEGLEAETRTEGLLTLAQVTYLIGEIDNARQQTLQAIKEAQRYDQTWLLACAQRLLGNIFSAQGQHEESATHFLLSLQTLKECGMRLEWARTLRDYNETILRRVHSDDGDCERAIGHLQEARKVFEECGAVLDLELVDRSLAVYAIPIEAAARQRDK